MKWFHHVQFCYKPFLRICCIWRQLIPFMNSSRTDPVEFGYWLLFQTKNSLYVFWKFLKLFTCPNFLFYTSYQLYKGRLENGTYIAIRSLPLFRNYLIRNLEIRLNLLSKLRHPHLVELMGYSIDKEGHDILTASRVFLVYEYVPNGNFRSHLSGQLYKINTYK